MTKSMQLCLALASCTVLTLAFGLGKESTAQEKSDNAEKAASAEVLRFGHEDHKGLGVKIDNCASCHGIKGFTVEPVTRGRNHQPCNNENCHASEYMSRDPKICVVCHDNADPWTKQVARIRNLPFSEFGGEISHKTHQSDKARKGGVNCASCHGNVFERGAKPEAHAVCGTCHQGGLKPSMGDCGSCHILGHQEKRLRSASPFSVRANFDHVDHRKDPRVPGKAAPGCKLCHSGVASANTLSEIPAPTMQSCDACHDGKHAFKTTGFGCAKCHGGSSK